MPAVVSGDVEIAVLGPVRMDAGGREIDLGTPRQRTIVAALALSRGRAVALDALVDRVWAGAAPPTAVNTLQRYVASLRRAIEPDRPAREAPSVLVTEGGGYALRIPVGARDVARFEEALAVARDALAVVPDQLRPRVAAAQVGEVERALVALDGALALWRGDPYAELGEDPDACAERSRLEDLRTSARELRLMGLLSLGRHTEVVGELESMTALHPLHERWWALYAVALVRSGRQAEALEALGSLRSVLADELGVDPSPPLRDLHTAILRQDPTLDWTEAGSVTTPVRMAAPVVPMPAAPPAPRWPLAGRRAELTELTGLLVPAQPGAGGAALVTGEAGAGKTRLAQEVMGLAHQAGTTVVVAACSAEVPPDLWPLRTALLSLARQLPGLVVDTEQIDHQPTEFRTREQVVESFLAAGATAPVLLVVEDVQWADPQTLLVLEQLLARRTQAPVTLLLTRRTGAGDEVRMTQLAETVARTDGMRVDLAPLTLADTEELVAVLNGSVSDVGSVWRRSGGNAFFVTELARTGGTIGGGLGDVVRARVASLPAETARALSAASTIDLSFDVRLLSLMLGRPEDETRDLLSPAIAAGLLLDDGDAYPGPSFAHAVVREVLESDLTATDRTTWHAKAGRAYAEHGDLREVSQRAHLARHWEQAGPRWSPEGWRAVLTGAVHARADAAYAEEARLLRLAVTLQRTDPGSGDRAGFDLLMLLADACRWSGDWSGVSDAVDDAIVVAERLGDDALAARAAISTTEGALWQVRPFGRVHPPIVEALERLLRRLSDTEGPLRCRAQLALAMELYYDPAQTARIDQLVDEALRYAEQSDDLRLRFTACHGAFVATWRLDTVEHRRALAEQAMDAARRLDDPRALVLAETLAVAAASELGDATRVRAGLASTIELARRRGLATAEGVLRVLALSWTALAGDQAGAAAQVEELTRLVETARVPNFEAAVTGTVTTMAMRTHDPQVIQAALADFAPGEDVPSELFGAAVLLRLGETELARATLDGVSIDLYTHTFMGPAAAAMACQVAVHLGATETTRRAYDYLSRHRGRMCSAGAATVLGPVDLFLAQGALALGDAAAAAQHLADSIRLIEEMEIPGLARDLDAVRAQVDRRRDRGASQ